VLQAVASKPIAAIPGLTAYAAGGFARVSSEIEISGFGVSAASDDNETVLALAAGSHFALGGAFSLFAELSYVDDAYIGGGASILF